MGNGRRGRGRGRGKRTMGGCNCPCGSILLCGVALIIHVSINCHFVVIVVHTPFSLSLSLSTPWPGAPLRLWGSTLKCQDEYQVFVHLPSRMRWLIPTRCCQNFLTDWKFRLFFLRNLLWLILVWFYAFSLSHFYSLLVFIAIHELYKWLHFCLGLSRAKVSSRHLES